MGDLVSWDLTVDPGPHDRKEIDAALAAAVGENGQDVLAGVSYDGQPVDPAINYDPTDDLAPVSDRLEKYVGYACTSRGGKYAPVEAAFACDARPC